MNNGLKKIFIIEDEDLIRENLEELLRMEGFKVYSADMGQKGIDLIKEIKPHLILCDVMLPDKDGYKIIQEVRSDESLLHIPFIFLTAKAEMKDLRDGMNLGADDYLIKPYKASELISVVKNRMELREKLFANEEIEIEDKDEKTEKLTIDDQVLVQSSNEVKRIYLKDIVCIIADAEYTKVFLNTGDSVLVRKIIKNWEDMLPEKTFIRIHRATIVNLTFLNKIEKWFNSSYRIMLNKYPEPLISSRRYSAKIRAKLLL